MLAFDLYKNNLHLARGCGRSLYGVGLRIDTYMATETTETPEAKEANPTSYAYMSLEGNGLEALGANDYNVSWLSTENITPEDCIELRIVEVGPEESAVFGKTEIEEKIQQLNLLPSIGIELAINDQAPVVFGAMEARSVQLDVSAIGFLGPDSLGNEAQRTYGKTSGISCFYNILGDSKVNDEHKLLKWAYDAPLKVGDTLKIRLVQGQKAEMFKKYEVWESA